MIRDTDKEEFDKMKNVEKESNGETKGLYLPPQSFMNDIANLIQNLR